MRSKAADADAAAAPFDMGRRIRCAAAMRYACPQAPDVTPRATRAAHRDASALFSASARRIDFRAPMPEDYFRFSTLISSITHRFSFSPPFSSIDFTSLFLDFQMIFSLPPFSPLRRQLSSPPRRCRHFHAAIVDIRASHTPAFTEELSIAIFTLHSHY
jgi:hypothetical protein